MPSYSEDSDSMGDSGYEMLTDSTLMTDEEDDGASSVASLEDDVDSSMVDSTESLASQPEHHDPDPIPSFGGLDEDHLDGSGMTMRDNSGSEEILFIESEEETGDSIPVVHKLNDFTSAEAADIWRHLHLDVAPVPALYSTTRQTMSRELLETDEPFRVLYVGSTAPKDEIQHKLAAALAAAISESAISSGSWDGVKSPRFNIVPISSFGSRSTSPEVELVDSTGLDMTFDVCSAAKASKHEGHPDTLSLWLNGNQNITSVWTEKGAQLENAGWKLPHLTVIYCSDDDNSHRRMTRVYARQFMARHAVPTLVISQKPLFNNTSEVFSLDGRAVHLCIESGEEGKSTVHKRLPIDLSTFLNLNPRQLNRNLGCITGLASPSRIELSSDSLRRSVDSSTALLRDVEKEPRGAKASGLDWIRAKKRDELWKLVLVGWLFACGLAGATFGIAYMKFTNTPESTLPIAQTISSILTPAVTMQSTASLASPAITTSSSQIPGMMSSIMNPSADFKQLVDSKMMPLNSSDRFQIHVIGNNHAIIRPPQKYLSLRKPPALFARVTRGDDIVNAELSKLFDGVYTLSLNEEDAWGVLKVSIWTKDRPIVKEDLEIDFGTPWMKVSRWVKLVEDRRTELQTLIDQAAIDAKDLSQTAGHQAVEIGNAMLSKAKEFSEDVSSGITKLCQDIMALPTKLSRDGEYVTKAQQHAKEIWERKKQDLRRKRNAKV
jgi:hypothetical protein